MASTKNPLIFNLLAECNTTKARVGKMVLPHSEVDTPVFMPVGTQVYTYFVKYYNSNAIYKSIFRVP